jgi:uncharacterized protein YbjT (DUF2867 family)
MPVKNTQQTQQHESSGLSALVIGATGLVGSHLVSNLIKDGRFSEIIIFVRRATGLNDPKLRQHIIDFEQPSQWQHLVKGDVLFSTLGTTRRKAGSKQAQHRVDYDYQYQFASAAASNNVPVLGLVSSVGARTGSPFFYARIKGELERDVKALPFEKVVILQPGPLFGERKEKRTGEAFGMHVVKVLNSVGLMKKYRPIHGDTVARAMINACIDSRKGHITHSDLQLFTLAKEQ